jgi:2-polyprenyl-6-methoxyphenol hydroxylase-like FAD-dependent oxidoreductase
MFMKEPLPVVAAGPTGLAAGLLLAQRDIRGRTVDGAAEPSPTSRAQVIDLRSLELLESTGVTAAVLKEARPIGRTLPCDGWKQTAELDFGPTHPRFQLSVLPQSRAFDQMPGIFSFDRF